jgi:hypothetical protein
VKKMIQVQVLNDKEMFWSYGKDCLNKMYSRVANPQVHQDIIDALNLALEQAKAQLSFNQSFDNHI